MDSVDWAGTPDAVVHWSPSSFDAQAILRRLRPAARTVSLTHLCPMCGSIEHGTPTAWLDGRAHPMSTATAGPHRVTILADSGAVGGAVGIDVDAVAEVDQRWMPEMVLHAEESASTAHDRAWFWVAKEALLKAWGTGLQHPMTAIRLADHAAHLRRIEAPNGYLAALVCLPERHGAAGNAV